MKPTDNLMAWKKCEAVDRVAACRVMLALHGFISEAENKKCDERIRRWIKKHSHEASSE